jgi:hypothetical protein
MISQVTFGEIISCTKRQLKSISESSAHTSPRTHELPAHGRARPRPKVKFSHPRVEPFIPSPHPTPGAV